MKKTSLLSLLLAITAVIPMNLHAQAIGDYDGDGTSDLSLGLVDRNRSYTAYLTRRSGNPSVPYFWEWGAAADAFAAGKFFGDGRTYPAIVRVVGLGQPLYWTFKGPNGGEHSLYYGSPGDTVPNHGPDFDGDGISDIYVVRDGTATNFAGFKIWYIALSGQGGRILQTVFGMKDDKVFGADVNGDGIAELVALRPSTYVWYSASIFSNDANNIMGGISAQQWGLPGDLPLLPQDIDGDGKPDYIISRREGTAQNAYIRFSNGAHEVRPLGTSTSIPSVGRFDAQRGVSDLAWQQRDTGWTAIRKADASLDLFQHGIATNAIIRPDGTVVQPNEDGRFPGAQTNPGEGPSLPPGEGLSSVCQTVQSVPRGFLWKPSSDHSGAPREGKPMVAWQASPPTGMSCIRIYASNGAEVSKFGIYTSGGHYGARWYSGWGCGDHKHGSAIAQAAQNTSGNRNVYVQSSGGRCIGPINPTGRNGALY